MRLGVAKWLALLAILMSAAGDAAVGPGVPSTEAGGRSVLTLRGPWQFRQVEPASTAEAAWMPATVPGCVHTDLLANKKIGDPFYRTNEKDLQWIDKKDWEYRTTFAVDDAVLARQRVELLFRGLDTYAEVFLNGHSVLWADNMFREWRVDARQHLKSGTNTLLVRFRSPIGFVKPAYDRRGYVLPAVNDQAAEMVSMYTRKAPYHYGWDWGPRFVTSGIWRPIELEAWDGTRLDDLQVFQQELGEARAKLLVKARVQAARAGRVKLVVDVGAGQRPVEVEAPVELGPNVVSAQVAIESPKRWWPNGLGEPHLYTIDATLSEDGRVRDRRAARIGLRTIEVVHEKDAQGKSFTIKVNGAPVFMKGANYIPSDSFVTRVGEERYRALLKAAVDANMNMLRVWGGGIYEEDRFYELCDEMGLLVWQDFMFACSMYPGDPAFVENVRQEAIQNVRRLRNHPSLALWAGNNEIEAAWRDWGWQWKYKLNKAAQAEIWAAYTKVFHEVLPAVVAAEDPGRFYTRSSPSANDDSIPANRLGFGDMHYWGVWHAEEPYTKYDDNTSRFMSEYGFQSFPELATVARYAEPGDYDVESPVMLHHQRHPRGNQLVRKYMDRDFRRPKDFASFLYLSQVLQAQIIQYGAEAHRRKMGLNWGSLYWQLDDCWPVASWSGIDYYGRWKALHYAARRFFAPTLVSVTEDQGTVSVHGISDARGEQPMRLLVRLIDFDGRELWRHDESIRLAPNASRVYFTAPKKKVLRGADPRRVVLVADLLPAGAGAAAGGRPVSRAIFTFMKTRDLALPNPELAISVEARAGGVAAVQVKARRFARAVFLRSARGDATFSDNYFDLLPGESATVELRPGAPGLSAEALRPGITAMSVVDSF